MKLLIMMLPFVISFFTTLLSVSEFEQEFEVKKMKFNKMI
ncbi:hypothetical protein JCM19302_2256 [Jejuia pallidilutea]|uniref:Uncharacterized protein n=1 Tax=Jejuia pallidilutea TaxID=504487 RepID=A0A090WAT1_9FLAO|nr:hypothetical protein JCM19302_2256 [Jejuia pallidilutea]